MIEEKDELMTKEVEIDTGLKEMFVQYVGNKLQPENGEVTVEMCVDVFSQEFPDFLILVAQENFLRGYQQAFLDMEAVEKQKSEE